MGLVSCVVLGFEMEGVEAGGEMQMMELDDYVLLVHILQPVGGSPVRARIGLREGADGPKVETVPLRRTLVSAVRD